MVFFFTVFLFGFQVIWVSVFGLPTGPGSVDQVWLGLSGRASEWLDSFQFQGLVKLDLQDLSGFDDLSVAYAALKRCASGQPKLLQSRYKTQRKKERI